jgi:EmrB/QacA subfamily drug resistance transporter
VTAVINPPTVPVEALDAAASRRWLILAVLGLAQMMVVLDGTIVNIALPTAQRALGFSNADRQWVVTAYALAFGSLLLLGGRLSDLFGRKRTFLLGLVGFAGASALGGAATTFGMLVTARAAQGAFGALLAPTVLALLTTTFTDPAERGRAFGIYGAILGAGGAIGLVLGGVLTTYASWRWTLFVNPVFAAIAVFGGGVLLRQSRAEHRPPLDLPGVVTVSSGLVALVYGFSHAETSGWQDPITVGFLIGGVALLGAFLAIEARVARPLLPLRVVRDRNRGGSYLAIFVAVAAMYGTFFFLTYYLQITLGYSAVRSGLAFLPMIAALIPASMLANAKLLPSIGPRPLIPTGLAVAAVGMIIFTRLGADSGYVTHILPGLLVLGVGLGLVMSPSTNTATVGVEPDDAGVASAMVNTSQQIAGSIGLSFLSTLAASAVTSFVAGKPASAALAAQAALHSYTVVYWWSAGILAAGAVATLLLLRPGHVTSAAPATHSAPALVH